MKPWLQQTGLSGAATTVGLAALLTVVIAAPVLQSPGTTIFGAEIVGRHHDPFTVMQQFAAGGAAWPMRQPLTDDVGALLTRMMGAIPAFNLLVLITFPLTALTTYLLGRALRLPHWGAVVAALLFAFSPVRMAQASYHVHIAQTQWLPLYFLAMIAAIRQPTLKHGVLLATAAGALVLSSYYGVMVAVIITPVALVAFWLSREERLTSRSLLAPALVLATGAIAAVVVIRSVMPGLGAGSAFAFPAADIARYGAMWWSYFIPPIDHPILGDVASNLLGSGIDSPGLLEQQLFLGWSVTALALIGVIVSIRRRSPPDLLMIAVAGIGGWSAIASLAPSAPGCEPHSIAVACLVHAVTPVFRAYARLGIVTSLCVAILAGHATGFLLTVSAAHRTWARAVALALTLALSIAVFEYWPLPGRARDVLPTAAHRWLASQPNTFQTLDCTERTAAEQSLPWLLRRRIDLLPISIADCADPDLVPKLSVFGYSHLLVRTANAPAWAHGVPPQGLQLAQYFPEAQVYSVHPMAPTVVVLDMNGFFDWEQNAGTRWRWMGPVGTWDLAVTGGEVLTRSLSVDLASVTGFRQIVVELDARPISTISVAKARSTYTIGPMILAPGRHMLRFRSVEPAVRPADVLGTDDRRALTVSLHQWRWLP